jgi:hypothetical protein
MIEWEQKCLRTVGWYAHMVPNNYHTHGLPMSFDHHPDIQVILPIDPNLIHNLVQIVVERIKKGERFIPGVRVSGIIRNMDVIFIEAMEDTHHEVLRMIIPDAHGNLDSAKMTPEFAAQYL